MLRLKPFAANLGIQLRPFHALSVIQSTPEDLSEAHKNDQGSLTSSETDYRLSMQRIMENFLKSNEQLLFIANDNVMFHKDFANMYQKLDAYCFDGLATTGVLKLESSIWMEGHFPDRRKDEHWGGWKLIDFEQKQTRSRCYSGHYANLGSVATIYSRKAVHRTLKWLSRDRTQPFDFVFNALAKEGVPIRTAEPNLAIANLGEGSDRLPRSVMPEPELGDYLGRSPTEAYKIHRWNVVDY